MSPASGASEGGGRVPGESALDAARRERGASQVGSNDGTVVAQEHLEVVRTARFARIGGGQSGADLWIVLHGYRQLAARFLGRFRHLATPDRLIVAPEALNRFYVGDPDGRHGSDARVGGTWMTREDRDAEIRDYVRYLDRLLTVMRERAGGAPRVGVLGFSQGVHTAARWVVSGDVRPARVVLWGAYLPADLPEERARERLARTRLVLVQGRADPHRNHELEREHLARLEALGIAAEFVEHDGAHELDADLLGRVMEG